MFTFDLKNLDYTDFLLTTLVVVFMIIILSANVKQAISLIAVLSSIIIVANILYGVAIHEYKYNGNKLLQKEDSPANITGRKHDDLDIADMSIREKLDNDRHMVGQREQFQNAVEARPDIGLEEEIDIKDNTKSYSLLIPERKTIISRRYMTVDDKNVAQSSARGQYPMQQLSGQILSDKYYFQKFYGEDADSQEQRMWWGNGAFMNLDNFGNWPGNNDTPATPFDTAFPGSRDIHQGYGDGQWDYVLGHRDERKRN